MKLNNRALMLAPPKPSSFIQLSTHPSLCSSKPIWDRVNIDFLKQVFDYTFIFR